MSGEPHTVEVVVVHEPEAPPPEPKGEAAPAPPAKGKGHVGDLSELAKATKAKFTESQAAKAAREAAAKEAPPKDEQAASELERAKADLEAASREIQALRAEVAQAHAHPLAWLSKCGMSPEALLGQLSRLDLAPDLRQHVQAIEQRRAAEQAHLSGRADAAQRDLDRVRGESALLDEFDADRERLSSLAAWVDRAAARERISPDRVLVREFWEEIERMKMHPDHAAGMADGRVTDRDVLDRLEERYQGVAPSTRSRRSETRRAADEDERPGKAAPPTLSNSQASEVTAALPIDLDAMDERTANRHLGAFAASLGVFKRT